MPDGAPDRARTLGARLAELLGSVVLLAPRDVTARVQAYLLRQNADMGKGNNVYGNLKTATSRELTYITMGPSFDKGPTESHFYLESGSRLSFGITLRKVNQRRSLVAYRFQLNLPEGRSSSFYRFDLNEKAHDTPLLEPRCHFHPGSEEIRRPCSALTPIEVLDRNSL